MTLIAGCLALYAPTMLTDRTTRLITSERAAKRTSITVGKLLVLVALIIPFIPESDTAKYGVKA
ncbi:hypothetical protein SAMN04487859_102156 [Roseovarius lutimaris]|uniref:Uncharacterized protein n=1 Tax=Roseovarius lutimaris TaxID=1005928 RepID=A0A1I4YZ04_9RHOB|nr:hypothetical protein SAMN04487859_102156 [Roseovarius lutimaris]